jgi:hypothetical protein
MIRVYINSEIDIVSTPIESDSCKYMIQTYEGGWWFAEDNLQTGTRSVFQIQDRIILRKKNDDSEGSSEIVLELLKPLEFNHNNTVGPKSISKQELILQFNLLLED